MVILKCAQGGTYALFSRHVGTSRGVCWHCQRFTLLRARLVVAPRVALQRWRRATATSSGRRDIFRAHSEVRVVALAVCGGCEPFCFDLLQPIVFGSHQKPGSHWCATKSIQHI